MNIDPLVEDAILNGIAAGACRRAARLNAPKRAELSAMAEQQHGWARARLSAFIANVGFEASTDEARTHD